MVPFQSPWGNLTRLKDPAWVKCQMLIPYFRGFFFPLSGLVDGNVSAVNVHKKIHVALQRDGLIISYILDKYIIYCLSA